MEKAQALVHKNAGNDFFHSKDYDQAIVQYTEAIRLDPANPTFYLNRAMVYKQKHLWNNCVKDSEKAVSLDKGYSKALALLGQALVEAGKQDTSTSRIKAGIKKFAEVLTMYKEAKEEGFARKIEENLGIANRILRLKKRALKKEKKEDVLCYIDDLLTKQSMKADKELEIKKKAKSLMEYNFPESTKLDSMEFMNCKITLSLMQDPVITNEGQTYEREALMAHLQKNANFDPTTRKPVTDIYPNRALKKAVTTNYEEYITEEDSNTDYHELHFS